ncbi:MAG: DHA2 family efflux MFS transporter permease subunit [Acidobacteriota bacterium]
MSVAEAGERPEINPWLTAIAVMFGSAMVYLDTTVVNLSLPYIAGSLSSSVNEATWSLTSYLAANAIVLPLSGWLASVVGRKRLLLLSIATFTLSSVLCGAAPTLGTLIVFRILQGLTGGVMQPLSQAIMLESFPIEQRGRAMGFWSLGLVLAPIIGPLLGGWLTEHSSWRWVFFINVPFGLLGLLFVGLWVWDPPYVRRRSEHVDVRGICLLALSIAAVQIALDRGHDEDWLHSTLIRALLVAAAVAGVWFILHAKRAAEPVVDLSVYRDATFAIGSLLSALIGFLLYGSIVLLPLMLQTLIGYPPVDAGWIIAQRGIGAFLAFPIVGVLADRWDQRKLLASGLVLGVVTMLAFAELNLDLGAADLFWPQFVQGVALGLLFVPMTTLTMARISNEQMGNASSLFNMTRNVGSSLGIALTSTYLQRTTTVHRSQLAERMTPYDPQWRERFGDGVETFRSVDAVGPDRQLLALRGALEEQSSLLAFLDTFRLFALVFAVMVPLVFVMRRR